MLKQLINDGFKFMFIPKRNRKKFYALKDNELNDNTECFEFKTENAVEVKLLDVLPRDVLIPIEGLL